MLGCCPTGSEPYLAADHEDCLAQAQTPEKDLKIRSPRRGNIYIYNIYVDYIGVIMGLCRGSIF